MSCDEALGIEFSSPMDVAALSNARAVDSLFRRIGKELEAGQRGLNEVAEALGIGIEEAYGMIRGHEDLTLSDLQLLLTACELRVTFDVQPAIPAESKVVDWESPLETDPGEFWRQVG